MTLLFILPSQHLPNQRFSRKILTTLNAGVINWTWKLTPLNAGTTMYIDKQILFKRIKILFFAVYSPCCINSIFLLVQYRSVVTLIQRVTCYYCASSISLVFHLFFADIIALVAFMDQFSQVHFYLYTEHIVGSKTRLLSGEINVFTLEFIHCSFETDIQSFLIQIAGQFESKIVQICYYLLLFFQQLDFSFQEKPGFFTFS